MQSFFSQKVFILSRKCSEMLNFNKILCFLPEVSSIGGYTFIPRLDRKLAPPFHGEHLLTALSLLSLQECFVPSPFLKRKTAPGEGIWLLIPWLSSVSPSSWAHSLHNHLTSRGRKSWWQKFGGSREGRGPCLTCSDQVFYATGRDKGKEERYLIRHFCLFHLKNALFCSKSDLPSSCTDLLFFLYQFLENYRHHQCSISGTGRAESNLFKENISVPFVPKGACTKMIGSTGFCTAALPQFLCSIQQRPLVLVLPAAFLFSPGCRRQWDNITCWPKAEVGEVVVRPCPKYFRFLTTFLGKRNQTAHPTEMVLRLHCLWGFISYHRGRFLV